jgi:hypothetical protein
MRKHLIPSLEESNSRISQLIESKKSFVVGRVGLGGGTAITALTYARQPINPQFYIWVYQTEGFYGIPDFNRFAQLYYESIQTSDLQAYWGDPSFPGFMEYENFITPQNQVLINPCSLDAYSFENPWTQSLAGKKVLIVHSFKDSIDSQLKIKDKIWTNKNVLPDAEYITYKPVQSLGGFGPHTSWYDSFDRMCQDISKIDFDVALLAAGGYGMPLSGYIKQHLNKGAIYVGGCLQLFFGIKGRRWDSNIDVTKYYNEYWIRASKDETPSSAPIVEGGCYW